MRMFELFFQQESRLRVISIFWRLVSDTRTKWWFMKALMRWSICGTRRGRDLGPAIAVLQLFCSSSKPTIRYTAVRTLSQVAMTHPVAVTACKHGPGESNHRHQPVHRHFGHHDAAEDGQ